ncbi:D-alanyl-D-alanine carboxypeptidase family protein [Oricola cellulosilytica]|uniref:D-alanyl-D-alanine carboxypeptidase n=1 Tax=Oricola cellulosilytica TaxID=1429082 RepID=A0A4R0P984_9HYPH|nr:D-alanyl-D-alanine carboxypeptidase family protein [Oricola cellulosilytica]TCD13739.1 D-alanyl-D-alanine carboxypeptidase [Oricola cellulosilytica]
MNAGILLRLTRSAAIAFLFSFPAAAAPVIVVDAASGRVLHSEDAFLRWSPASLTKLMTAYVAFREIESGRLNLKSPVRISTNAAHNPPSHMAYPVGTIITLENALKMIIVKSANDIAVAIGESIAGTEEDFVIRMNQEAHFLGMTDTNFENPNGLHADGQYSTARDLAILTRAIRTQYPQYADLFSIEAIRDGERVYKTYNDLIGRFQGADGMKTGYVCESGFNLAASATQDGRTMIAIILGEIGPKGRAERAATLLQKAFDTGDETGLPLITDLAKTPDTPETPVDMRPIVCSDAGRAARQSERGEPFDTALLTDLDRPPVAVAVGKGGAIGSSRSATMVLGKMVKEVPLPADKPERVTLVDEDDRARYALEPGFDVPVPDRRPET